MLVVLLNDVHSILRDLAGFSNEDTETQTHNVQSASVGGGEKGGDGKWVPPSSFERVTTKYWVKEQDLSQVVLTSITELPLLVYGRKGGRILDRKDIIQSDAAATPSGNNNALWSSVTSSISSVYLDSPDLHLYNERLKRSEGAKLLRIRWYGNAKPSGDDIVYLELKTHHEKWLQDRSVKERCPIREKDVPQLLNTSTGRWDMQKASALVRLANRTDDDELINDLSELLLRMRDLICKLQLSPSVRTCYTRIALQSTSTNKVRFTIDRDIQVINERPSPSKSWCLNDEDTINSACVIQLPYCVFEVKVSGEDGAPSSIAELKDYGVIVEARKFSKFLSGASLFNSNTVDRLPWWASDGAFAPLYGEDRDLSDGVELVHASSKSSSTESTSITTYGFDSTGATTIEPNKIDVAKAGPKKRSARRRSTVLRSSFLPITNKQQEIAPKRQARVEPKSYFANERTFIQWISAALLIITISQLLFILGADRNVESAGIAATWLIAMSLFIAVYALAIYYRRIYLMRSGKPYGYVDFVGPSILTSSIVAGVILLLVYSYQAENRSSSMVSSTMIEDPGQCVRRSLQGIPILELQPSGAIIDNDKSLLLLPSLRRILALEDGVPNDPTREKPVQVVANIPGANLEALEYIGDRIFALSEGPKESEIIELEWTQEHLYSRHLIEVQRWKIGLRGAEAMSVVPGFDGLSPSKLVVAGLSDDGSKENKSSLSVDVFDVGSLTDSTNTAVKYSTLNKKTLAKGLKEEKVASMQYFDGLLYLLFDNARVIRAFDVETGEIMQETQLPVSAMGSELEWEGMRLQRIPLSIDPDVNSGTFLRGSSTLAGSSDGEALILHLALDTPAQVWSLHLNEGSDDQGWSLPDCAIK
jgi:uncharacterized membrane protein YidH (DUF202 family)